MGRLAFVFLMIRRPPGSTLFPYTPLCRSRIPNMVRHNRGETLEARYDAAQTTETNARHWSMADLLNADESNSPHVRSTLRTRARYECLQANSYGRGIVETLSLDLVGSGPRIQVLTDNEKANSIIQNSFHRWMRQIGRAHV